MCNNIRECRLWFHEPINRALICSIPHTSIRKYFSSHVLVLFFVLSFKTRYQHECSAYFLEVSRRLLFAISCFPKLLLLLVILFFYLVIKSSFSKLELDIYIYNKWWSFSFYRFQKWLCHFSIDDYNQTFILVKYHVFIDWPKRLVIIMYIL